MSDIVERLRGWVYTGPLYATAQEAADEIEKLRHRVRFADNVIRSGDVATLTEAEREAVERARRVIAATMPYESQQGAEDYQTLRGLLERLSPPAT